VFPVEWEVSRGLWGPFPERGPGSLRYPTSGSGWYPAAEVDAARRIFGRDSIRPTGPGWAWEPSCDHRPLDWLPEIAATHSKTVANAVYGRLAQTVGWATWQAFPWSATITGRVRAAMLTMAAAAGSSARLITTDGLITDGSIETAHPRRFRVRAQALGPVHVVQAGIYTWGDGARSRGLEVARVPFDRLARVWAEKGWRASLTVRVPLYCGPQWAAEIGWEHWRSVIDQRYRIAYDPTPRRIPQNPTGRGPWLWSVPPSRWHLDAADAADAWRPPAWRNDRDQPDGTPGDSW
jgi:hypothetical protein